MRRVPCEFLQPGMRVASSVYDSNGMILLAKGVLLSKAYIKNLARKGIPFIYIEDDISRDIYINDVVLEETRAEATRQIKETITDACSRLVCGDQKLVMQIKTTITKIVTQLMDSKNLIYDLIDLRSVDDYLFGHSVNVSILSLITGISMKYDPARLEQLAAGAILHDIGKCLVPPYILSKPGKLTEVEFDEIKRHPVYSLKLLRSNPDIDSVSRTIAFQHHERDNGEGYPLGQKGGSVLEMSQIVGITDMYDAMTSNRCYREAMPPDKAYRFLAKTGGSCFKADVLKAFLSKVAVYPSGSVVRLSTGHTAIVARNRADRPTDPTVRILAEPGGATGDSFGEMDLSDHAGIVVKRVLKESEIKKYGKMIKASGILLPGAG